MDPSQVHPPVVPTDTVGPYFDLVKPISIPNTNTHPFHHNPDIEGILPDQDTVCDTLPDYLHSFHDSGISDARLKQFNWLHPRNYSGEGSLSDDYTLSPYGTSVSSPRGDEWEIVDRGPRKNIDELWDEVFEYRQRIKLLEQVHEAQALAEADEEQDDQESTIRSEQDPVQHPRHGQTRGGCWSEYGGGSETCCSPVMGMTIFPSLSLPVATIKLATLGQTPTRTATTSENIVSTMLVAGTMTQIDTTMVYASKLGVRSDRGAALRTLLSFSRARP
ncbi:hypothetical protein BGZ51_004822 [Haplosporangium sp. Z 767]|nr:hypothetical protein BGZ51_004822 [Haplosporangium sp. Z 767]KAF9187003.1 hypothetical protein BGZ50_002171 [Haplosporangium sp. Z 11]